MARILYLTGMQPVRMANGTEIATRMIADMLGELGHTVILAGYSRPDDPASSDPSAVVIDRRTIEFADASTLQKATWAAEALLRNEPLSVTKYRRPAEAYRIAEQIRQGVDCFLVDKPQMLVVLRRHLTGRPISVVWHAIEHQTYAAVARDSRGLQRRIYRREANLAGLMEKALLRDVQHIFTLTPSDAKALTDLGYSGPIDVAPMIVPPTTQQQIAASDAFDYDVGALGNWTWSANASGLEWFLREVRPLLPGNMSIAIGGRGADAVAPEVTTVTRTGYVEDARVFLARCRVVAIPLQAGTGISMKVLEAACAGWPTVTTSIGARGIPQLPDNVTVADLPQEFADALIRTVSVAAAQREQWMRPAAQWMHDRRAEFANALKSGIDHVAR